MARHLIDRRISTSDPRDVKRFGQLDAESAGARHPVVKAVYRHAREPESRRLTAYLRIDRGHHT